MHVITFYSYKGGVGRTLVVANVAKYLARFGQKVLAVDFDLEAPGLHYKFRRKGKSELPPIARGVVDYIHSFLCEGQVRGSLRDYVLEVERQADSDGAIWLMPAGNVPSADYWHKLARISWHELFYAPGARGIPFFLEYKQLIEKEFQPDFLLIDSRTGITEIGGIATSLLPEKVVCLLMNNPENLEGAREVLRSVRRAARLPGQSAIEILPVVTRIPQVEGEARILKQVRDFLNEEAADLAATLDIPEVFVLHSDRELEVSEALRISEEKTADESTLLRDYLRLFVRLVPRDIIETCITPLVNHVMSTLLDAPETTQTNLEALSQSYPHPECYLALLKLYRLRRVDLKMLLSAAFRFSQITNRADDPLLWELVRDKFPAYSDYPETVPPCPLPFVEAVWRAAAPENTEFALKLCEWYTVGKQRKRAERLLEDCIERNGPTEEAVVGYMDLLSGGEQWQRAFALVEKVKGSLAQSGKFVAAWARLLAGAGDSVSTKAFLDSQGPKLDRAIGDDFSTYVQLLLKAGRNQEVSELAHAWLKEALAGGPSRSLRRVGSAFLQMGRFEEFETAVRKSLGDEMAAEFLQDFRRDRHRVHRKFRPD